LALERLETDWLTTSVAGAVICRVLKLHSTGKWDGPHTLMNTPADAAEERLVSELLAKTMPGTALEAAAGDCLATLERAYAERQLQALRTRQRQTDLTAEEHDKILRQVLDLQRQLRDISSLSRKHR